MKLHENKILFRQAVQFTADQMKIPAIYVEKDYWVTYALYTIFNNDIGKDTVFKGGTALSKCYNMIERFSEVPIEGITHKIGMNRKTAHSYNKEFKGDYGQVRDVIILESTWLGYYEPHSTKSIVSFVGQMMMDNEQFDIAKENRLLPFDLLALEPTRTICEKVMSLVRFSYGENPIDDLKKKIRHTYDLHQLLKQDEFLKFFQSTAFDEMLLKVANDDVASFRNNNKWLNYHPNEALIFKDLENIWSELKTIYNGDFKNLVYGALPKDEAILQTLKMIQERLKTISWTIITEFND
jgi:hypothetical protein